MVSQSKQLDYRAHMKTEKYASPTKAPSTARTITQESDLIEIVTHSF
jgi:hypothetical protein